MLIEKFVERVRRLSSNSGLASGIGGTTHHQTIMLDLYKSASLLQQAHAQNKLDEQLEEIVGALHVAQAMNVIGYDDLEELMVLLEAIRKEYAASSD